MKQNEISADEITLAPPTEIYEMAERIAESSAGDPKYSFIIKYDLNQKDFFFTVLNKMGCVVEKELDSGNKVILTMSMTQLKGIKTLDCVEQVWENRPQMKNGTARTNVATANVAAVNAAATEFTSEDVATLSLASETGTEVATASTSAKPERTLCSECASANDMASAITLKLDQSREGCICCPGSEVWYKIVVDTRYTYTIYTTGYLDTEGYLYDWNGNPIACDDDSYPNLNFKIQKSLLPGKTYYLCVKAYGDNTGEYSVQITNEIFVSSVEFDKKTVTMRVGDSVTLTATVSPDNASDKRVFCRRWGDDVVDIEYESDGYMMIPVTVTAKAVGSCEIHVYDWFERGAVVGVCMIQVVDHDYYNIINKATGEAVSFNGTIDTKRQNNVCPGRPNGSNGQIWKIDCISATEDCYVRSYLDEDYGFNAYRKDTGNYNCDLMPISGNADAKVHFMPSDIYIGYYRINLVDYPNYYLTRTSGNTDTDADIRWQKLGQGDCQLWKLESIDWEQYEAEQVEYHVLCGGDATKALRVGTKNVLDISTDLPVRGERLSYWNRQKWTIKGEGTKKRLCSQLDNEYFLCDDGTGKAYVSNNASDANSYLTITPYADTGKYTIKLSGSDLYLTLSYGEHVVDNETFYAEWGKWSAFNQDDPSLQLWQFTEQPAINHIGVDTSTPIGDTTAEVLKKNGIKFVCRYYATKAMINNVAKILTEAEVTCLHGQGLNIISIYEDGGKTFSTERGLSDATEALRLATMLGQPEGSTIYFGVEPDYADQKDLIEAYFKAVQETFKTDGRYKVGIYGPAKACNNIKDTLGYAKYSWLGQSNGASNSLIEGNSDYISYDQNEKYDIKQSEPIFYNGIEFDSNTAIKKDYGQW